MFYVNPYLRFLHRLKTYYYIYYFCDVKKVIEIDKDDMTFMKGYKKSHGVLPSAFIDIAIREKILKIKAEIKLQEYVSNK